MGLCTICETRELCIREFCNRCYDKGRRNGTILLLQNPQLPTTLSKEQVSLVVGSMLGDGNLSKRSGDARLNIGRAKKDLKYLEWEFDFFKDFCLSGIRFRDLYDPRYDKTYHNVSFSTRNSPIFTTFYTDWYPSGKKIVPKCLELDPLSLAVWFCDDGSVTSSYQKFRLNLQLCTNGFSKDDVEFLISLLEKRYNEQFRLAWDKQNPIIKAGDNATRAFLHEIDGYVPKAMERKAVKWRADEHRFYTDKPRRTYYKVKHIDKLTGIELELLSYIKDRGNVTSKQLLELGIKKSRVSYLLKTFERLGYLIVTKKSTKTGYNMYNVSETGIGKIQ